MDDVRRGFLEVVTQVRTHLELQRALGVRVVEIASPERLSQETNAPKESRPVSAFPKGGVKEATPIPKLEEPRFAAVQSSTLAAVQEKLRECTRCKLCKNRKNIVFGEGNPEASLVFVGEGPGQEEDEQARPFVGAAGQLLTDIIVKGMKLEREDVYICNIVKCRPPDNRNPEPDEIKACEPFLIEQLGAIKPKIIIALGNIAAKTLLQTNEGITALRGKWQTCRGMRLMPTFHPAYLLRNASGKKLVWEDIKKVMAEMEKIGKG